MPEFDVALRQLGRHIEWPPTPELAPAVRSRIGKRRAWRPVAIALAVLVVAVGAVMAVPPARTAIFEWLGIKGVKITRVEQLPPTPVVGNLDLGRPVTLAEARRRAPWLLVPTDAPDSVHYSDSIPGGKVTLLWGTPTSVRLLLTEFRGETFIEKLIQPETNVEEVTVDGKPGVWLEDRHVVLYRNLKGFTREDTARLVGQTLLWQDGEVTLRLEGDLSKEEALRIARSAD